jgi:GWxTD domain-containing protein
MTTRPLAYLAACLFATNSLQGQESSGQPRAQALLVRATELEAAAGATSTDPLELAVQSGFGPWEKVLKAYAAAAEADPALAPALLGLWRTDVLLGDSALARKLVLPAFRRAATTRAGTDPTILMAWADVEWRDGNLDSAAAAAARALDAGAPASQARYAWARARLASREPDAARAWYLAAGAADTVVFRLLRQDLAWIATGEELQRFDAAADTDRVAVLQTFWSDRGRSALEEPSQRLAEHYRRINHAQRQYRLRLKPNPFVTGPSGTRLVPPFDDRGRVYVRLGPPDAHAGITVYDTYRSDSAQVIEFVNLPPGETWRYDLAAGQRVFDFSGGAFGYHLQPGLWPPPTVILPPPQLSGSLELIPHHAVTPESIELEAGARRDLAPVYRNMMAGDWKAAALESQWAVESIFWFLVHDVDERRFPRPLALQWALVALADGEGSPQGELVFTVPVASLRASTTGPDSDHVWLRLRLSTRTSAGRSSPVYDSILRLHLPPSAIPTAAVIGRFTVPLAPGRVTWIASLQAGDSTGAMLTGDTLQVMDTRGRQLAMTGLAVGSDEFAARWLAPGGDTVVMSPSRVLPRERPVELYYEVHGLAPGSQAVTELAITGVTGKGNANRLFARLPADYLLRTSDRSVGSTTRVRRTLDLSSLKPGRYRLEVIVRDGSGATALQTADIELLASKRKQ